MTARGDDSPPRLRESLAERFHQLGEDELTTLTLTANGQELELLLHHPRLTEGHVLAMIRNKNVTVNVLRDIGSSRRWPKSYDVKHALTVHPRAPRHIALRFVKFLYLAHLTRLLDDHQVPPGLKRHAESLLGQRLPQVTLGERLTMAKTGGRGVIKVLRGEREPRVLAALLRNPRTTTRDVVEIVAGARTPPAAFAEIPTLERWSSNYDVKLALARSPRAPVGIVLGTLTSLRTPDLEELRTADGMRRLVRLTIERVLEERRPSDPPGGPSRPGPP